MCQNIETRLIFSERIANRLKETTKVGFFFNSYFFLYFLTSNDGKDELAEYKTHFSILCIFSNDIFICCKFVLECSTPVLEHLVCDVSFIGVTEARLNHFVHWTSIFITKLTLVEFESSLTP